MSEKRWNRREFLERSSVALVGVGVLGGACKTAQVVVDEKGGKGESLGGNDAGVEPGGPEASVERVAEGGSEVTPEPASAEKAGVEQLPEEPVLADGRPFEPTPEAGTGHEPPPETFVCKETHDNIEGPYYRQNPPWKTQVAGQNEAGTRLTIAGTVYGFDCRTPLSGVTVDVWQANDKGSYDNDGQNDPPNQAMVLRARMKTNNKGQYMYETIVPGRYLNGATYRPAHIHYKVYDATDYKELTTQLYFQGDPYIAGDAFVHASLVIPLRAKGSGKEGSFDIVLAKKA